MKQKFLWLAILIAFAQLPASAQYMAQSFRNGMPIITEDAIRNVVISDNIDVLLIEDRPERIGVKVPSTFVDKLDVRVHGESLYLSAAKNLAPGERLHVFVTVNDLNRLELRGNAYATTKGILQSKNLAVILKENARVALRSKGEVTMSTPNGYHIKKEKDFYSVYAVTTL